MIVRAARPEHFGWLIERADFTGCSPNFRALEAVNSTGRIMGMTGFDGWTENSVVVSIALDNPLALRSLIEPTFEFVFTAANRGVLICTVRASNKKSVRLCQKIGFRETYRIRDAVTVGEDLILFEMRREECRYLNGLRKVA
jgi:RimJ/RimL family protein N-acetyltransferase